MNLEEALKRIEELEERVRKLEGAQVFQPLSQLIDARSITTTLTVTRPSDFQGVWYGGAGQH